MGSPPLDLRNSLCTVGTAPPPVPLPGRKPMEPRREEREELDAPPDPGFRSRRRRLAFWLELRFRLEAAVDRAMEGWSERATSLSFMERT